MTSTASVRAAVVDRLGLDAHRPPRSGRLVGAAFHVGRLVALGIPSTTLPAQRAAGLDVALDDGGDALPVLGHLGGVLSPEILQQPLEDVHLDVGDVARPVPLLLRRARLGGRGGDVPGAGADVDHGLARAVLVDDSDECQAVPDLDDDDGALVRLAPPEVGSRHPWCPSRHGRGGRRHGPHDRAPSRHRVRRRAHDGRVAIDRPETIRRLMALRAAVPPVASHADDLRDLDALLVAVRSEVPPTREQVAAELERLATRPEGDQVREALDLAQDVRGPWRAGG